jgi:hypothetical protein
MNIQQGKKMKKMLFLVIMGALVAFTGCKGTNEKRGDEHLEAGRFRNAINSYLEAKKKGKISDEFYDNFALALIRAADAEAKKDLNSQLLSGYFEQAQKALDSAKKDEVTQEFVTALANLGKLQAAQETDYGTVLNAFAKLDTAMVMAKRKGVGEGAVKTIRAEAENAYVKVALPNALSEEDPVVREYFLLQIDVVAPENAELKEALNKSRINTRGYFLIFGENIGERPSNRVDKWGYVMAFPSIKISSTSLTGELQVWASTGNNTEFVVDKIKLVSTDGKEVFAKQTGSGWCEAEVVVGKKGNEKVEKKKASFKGKGKLLNEFQCSANIAFTFDSSFTPDYIEYKDEMGIGRKYLGQ